MESNDTLCRDDAGRYVAYFADKSKYEILVFLTKRQFLNCFWLFTLFLNMIPDLVTLSYNYGSRNSMIMANEALGFTFRNDRTMTDGNSKDW